ncbi:ABC transporter permease [Microbacterium protaetiae]|uniref:ABC transporter permease n=1 Tax=Microbacterium protaetiae TaxID=2509458 RepID=A0A4P6EE66_9MICO|nr:ABC transporter permease [Microbacterium protaetiae]QAY59369.1 ABC transporter permease [Microbacterium protaetiae]
MTDVLDGKAPIVAVTDRASDAAGRAPAASAAAAAPATQLITPRAVHRHRERSAAGAVAARLGGPALIVAIWWVATATGLLTPDVLASPAQVGAAAVELWTNGQLPQALAVSLARAGGGLAIGVSIGLLLGLIAGSTRSGDAIFDSAMQTLRALPFLALVPLFMVWFGIGETARIALVAVATTFPMYVSASGAVRATDAKLLEAASVFGLSRWATARQIILPGALPGLFSGLRLSATLSIIALIAAEEINALAGLGYLMSEALNYSRTDILTVCILIYGAFGLIADTLIRGLERLATPWLRRKGARR